MPHLRPTTTGVPQNAGVNFVNSRAATLQGRQAKAAADKQQGFVDQSNVLSLRGDQLSNQNAELGNQQGQAQLQTLKDKNNFLKIFSNAAPFMGLQGDDRQSALLNNIAEKESQGVDMTQAKVFANMPPDQQNKSFESMTQIGQQLGHIQAPRQSAAPSTKTVLNAQGERVFATNEQISRDPSLRPTEPSTTLTDVLAQQLDANSPSGVAEKAGQKKIGEGTVKAFREVKAEGKAAKRSIIPLKRMKKQIENGLDTGLLANVKANIGALALSFGVDKKAIEDNFNTSDIQVFKNGVMTLVLDRVSRTKGAISDREMEAFRKSVANASNTVAANKLLLDMGIKIEERMIEKSKFFGNPNTVKAMQDKENAWELKIEKRDASNAKDEAMSDEEIDAEIARLQAGGQV